MPESNDLKKLNKLLVDITEINLQFLQASDEKTVCQQTCNYLVKIKDYKFVWMGLKGTENGKFTPIALSGRDKDFIQFIKDSWDRYGFNGCSTSIALKSGSHYINEDLKNEKRFVPWDKIAIKEGFLSALVLPIKNHDDVIGTLHVYTDTKNYFSKEEVLFLDEVAVDASLFIKNITEKKQIELRLKEEKERFQILFDKIPTGVVLIGLDYKFLETNSKFRQISGYSSNELKKLTFSDITYNEDIPSGLENTKELLEGKKSTFTLQKRYVKKNKGIIWCNLVVNLVKDKEGIPLYFISTVEDISKEKQAEEKLTASNKQYKNLVEMLPEIVIETNKDLNIKYANKSFYNISGYSKADVKKGINVFQLLGPGYKTLAKENIESIMRGGSKSPKEYKLVKKNGSIIYGITNSNAVYDDNKHFSGLRIVGLDITQKKNQEDALITSEQSYKLLFENTTVGVSKSTIEGKYLDVNPALVKILGYESKKELLKLDISKQIYFSEKNRPDINNRDKSFIVKLKKKDKTTIWAIITSHIFYEKKKPKYYLSFVRDITALKLSEENLKASYIKAQKTIWQIISTISRIVEVKDPYTSGHQKNVARIAVEIAKELGLSDDKIEALNIASLLHDTGKVTIPASILSKPGKLSELEFSMIKDHAKTGYDILKEIDFGYPVAEIVLQHHEKLDGSGYPSGLKGKNICIEARVLAVADVVEAMGSHRPYRPALKIEKTIEELRLNSGILYDKKVVDAYLSLTLDVEEIKLGQHLCAFYDNPIVQFSYIIPYIISGLKKNEKCFYILDENTHDNLKKAFTDAGFEISGYLKSKQLIFYTKAETYMDKGYFEPVKMINLLKEAQAQALKEGYKGIRITGEMTWAFGSLENFEKLIEYENKLNEFFPDGKACTICQYNEKRFDEEVLTDIIATHPKIIIDGLVYKNNHFLSPDEFTKSARDSLKQKSLKIIKNRITKKILIDGNIL